MKNKLNTSNRNILMHLFYKNKVIVEMQLVVKQEKSKFIDCSNKFAHYLYELSRAKFGPIMEMCNIWMSIYPTANFFAQKIENLNLDIKFEELYNKYEL